MPLPKAFRKRHTDEESEERSLKTVRFALDEAPMRDENSDAERAREIGQLPITAFTQSAAKSRVVGWLCYRPPEGLQFLGSGCWAAKAARSISIARQRTARAYASSLGN